MLTLERSGRFKTFDSPELLPSCLRAGSGCADTWTSLILPQLNVTERSYGDYSLMTL